MDRVRGIGVRARAVGLALALVVAAGIPGGALAADPGGTGERRAAGGPPVAPRVASVPGVLSRLADEPVSVDLLRPGDFVAQTNDVQCIGASIQTMLNIIRPRNDRTPRTQARVQQLARDLSQLPSDPPRRWRGERRGASVRGWARAMPQLGAGHYVLRAEATLDGALRAAATAIARTGRPVGLLVWRGRHAWVMTGFRSRADARAAGGFRVTSVTIADPWYPRISPVWGRSPRPGSRLSPGQLGQDFVKLNRSWMRLGELRYVLVLPVPNPPQPASIRVH